jgi:hypothetical protein
MIGESPHPPALAGPEATATIVKTWLVDGRKTWSGVIGVDDALQVVSLRTFQNLLTPPALNSGLGEAIQASATGIVAYQVTEGERPAFDRAATARLTTACEALNITLLDVMIYSQQLPGGWLSARQQNII